MPMRGRRVGRAGAEARWWAWARGCGGAVKIRIDQRYALADAAQAHRDLEARKTTGSTVFTI